MIQEDIYKRVAERTGYSEDLIKFVVKDYWKSLHFYLKNPLACGKKILVTRSFEFVLNAFAIGKRAQKADYLLERIPDDDYAKANHYYINELIKQLVENERQAWRSVNNGRDSIKAKRQEREKRKNLSP